MAFAHAAPVGAADLAAVTSQGAGALSLLDPGAGTVLATVPLPGKPAPHQRRPGATYTDGTREEPAGVDVSVRQQAAE